MHPVLSNRLAFVALAAACIGAAAGGGYLASRQTSVPAITQAAPATLTPNSSTGAAAVATPVQETEAVVGDSSKAPVAIAPVSTPATPARRSEPPARPASQPTASKATQTTANRSKASEPLPTLDRTW